MILTIRRAAIRPAPTDLPVMPGCCSCCRSWIPAACPLAPHSAPCPICHEETLVRPERCSHSIGGTERCRYCLRLTCALCHHARRHLDECPETKRRETRER